MTTRTLPRPLALHRGLSARLWDFVIGDTHRLSGRIAAETRARWQRYLERRTAEQAERELRDLSPGTLQDIGAPQGLVGQRRWQDEREDRQLDRLLDLRGW